MSECPWYVPDFLCKRAEEAGKEEAQRRLSNAGAVAVGVGVVAALAYAAWRRGKKRSTKPKSKRV